MIALLLRVFALAISGYLTATIAVYLLGSKPPAEPAPPEPSELRRLRAEIARLERLLEPHRGPRPTTDRGQPSRREQTSPPA